MDSTGLAVSQDADLIFCKREFVFFAIRHRLCDMRRLLLPP